MVDQRARNGPVISADCSHDIAKADTVRHLEISVTNREWHPNQEAMERRLVCCAGKR
jgi:hypothetical protein